MALFCALALCLWEASVLIFNFPAYVLPSASAVFLVIIGAWGELGPHLIATTWKAFVAAPTAVAVALGLTLLSDTAALLRNPILITTSFLEAIPKVAIAPLLIIWLGVGTESKIFLAVLICLYPAYQRLEAAWLAVPGELVDFAKSLGASPLKVAITIRLRWIVADLWECLRLCIPLSFVGVMLGEIVASEDGIGTVVMYGLGQLDMALVMACAFGIGLISSAAVLLCSLAHRSALSHRDA
ncbi:ABC transporter permease subunit [Paracoccus sp. CPCC 101403]|uniref:ABC transporter permease subunit n=1 Tax=Paracoccus broussonetiae TaxID=3075834 RepID=A0ABU3EKA1_9RHOB|nr:ABC transporter permease subunit [Paracoccus sp. CPCC 101403]MDT1064659.1 ABC transporter permease subunit [Paracoccus sp. CPCC 101403]